MSDTDATVKLFKALMHPARLEILDILRDGEECVCHIESALGYRQAYISQQLMILREVGLVQDRRDGWNIFYRVTEPKVYAVIDAARAMTTGRATASRKSTRSARCSCPRCNPVAEAAAA